MQEVTPESYIEIPDPVRRVYTQWRPSPLFRARRLEQAARYARPHLLQVRRRQPGGEPQAEYRSPPGLL